MSDPLRAAVVGSGFGGLAAAIRLQARGVRTVLFEGRPLPGGRAYVYRDAGYTFDAGPTVITAPHCLEELFSEAGRRMADYVELLPVTPFYRLVWPDGVRFDYVGETDALLEQIRRINPADVDGYLRFADYARRVFAKGYEELGAVPFLHFWDMVRAAPQLAALRADRSVYATVSRFIRDEHLRQAFSFHPLLVGGNPLETSAIYTLIHHLEKKWGVWFPRGGTGALVRGLVRLFTELGGELRLSCPVRRIELEHAAGRPRHRVTSDGCAGEPFDLVVSNADLHHTYATLYEGEPAARTTVRRLERMTWSMSLVVIYFGTRGRYPDLAHHTILFGPRFRGLLQDIFHGHRLPEDFSLYLHAPSVTDPSLAPPGGEAFYVLSPVPHLGNAPLEWSTLGPACADRILEALEGHLPGLRGQVVTRRVFTPADFAGQLNARHGSAFSVAPLLTQSAYFRPHNRDPRIPGLYLVGAGTHPGAGVPGVVNSAKATVRVIAQDFPGRLKENGWPMKTVDQVSFPPVGVIRPAVPEELIQRHSKSFALAARLLPADLRPDVVGLYAWCRLCDDAVDQPAPAGNAAAALAALEAGLEAVYAGAPMGDPVWSCFQGVVRRRVIPVAYPTDLLRGFAMDVHGCRYESAEDLLLYCYRVAGTVGLMLCHVLGVTDDRALAHAAHLGMAMQLTNIARDVREDADRGRSYLPSEWTGPVADPSRLERGAGASAVRRLLALADRYYRSGDAGLRYLAPACRRAILAARWIYAAIGSRLAARGWDIDAGRAVVPGWRKRVLVLQAFATPSTWWPARAGPPRAPSTIWDYQPPGVVPAGACKPRDT